MSSAPVMRERSDNRAIGWVLSSRVILWLTGLLVLVMPLTEYLWNFDHFLKGGQDLELGLFSLAMVVCLILVLMQRGSRGFSSILAVRILAACERLIPHPRSFDASPSTALREPMSPPGDLQVPSPSLSQRTLPILV